MPHARAAPRRQIRALGYFLGRRRFPWRCSPTRRPHDEVQTRVASMATDKRNIQRESETWTSSAVRPSLMVLPPSACIARAGCNMAVSPMLSHGRNVACLR